MNRLLKSLQDLEINLESCGKKKETQRCDLSALWSKEECDFAI